MIVFRMNYGTLSSVRKNVLYVIGNSWLTSTKLLNLNWLDIYTCIHVRPLILNYEMQKRK